MKRIFKVIYKKKEGLMLQKQPDYFMEQVYYITGLKNAFDIPTPIGFEIYSYTELLQPKDIILPTDENTSY